MYISTIWDINLITPSMLANYMKTQKTNNNKLTSIFNIFYSNQQFLFETMTLKTQTIIVSNKNCWFEWNILKIGVSLLLLVFWVFI